MENIYINFHYESESLIREKILNLIIALEYIKNDGLEINNIYYRVEDVNNYKFIVVGSDNNKTPLDVFRLISSKGHYSLTVGMVNCLERKENENDNCNYLDRVKKGVE